MILAPPLNKDFYNILNKISCINYVRQDEEFSNISSQCMRVLLLLLFIKICATNYCNRF